MGSRRSTQVQAPNPTQLIEAQRQANRIDQTTPFGSATYTRGPDGRDQFNTTLSPEMQGVFNQALGIAQREPERYTPPQGFDQFVNMVLGSNMGNYGGWRNIQRGARNGRR